jgi:outer membrane receptor protein involved in Fe transport
MVFQNRRPALALGISTLAMAVALTVAEPAYAQSSSTIQGHVTGVTAGAVVTATNAGTGEHVNGTVNAQGNYTLVGVRPGNYHVAVPGAPAQDVNVPVGQIVIVDMGNEPTGTGGEIVVRGSRLRNEVRTAEVSTNVSTAQIENLPQNDRNFLNFAALAPGVIVTPTSGARQIRAGALSADNINVFIDGLSLKNPINHGGIAGQNFSKGNPFPQLAVQEFKVDTQNFKAEYEQAGSAIITAVTKTGGTDFHGDLFGEFQPKGFVGRPYFDRPGHANNVDGSTPKPPYKRWQYGGDLGGPIIKDVLHFYVAYEATKQDLPSASVNLDTTPQGGIPGVPASVASQLAGSYGEKFDQQLYFGKLTLFATSKDTINGSAFLRRENNLSDFGGTAAPSHGHELTSNNDTYQIEWNHRGDHWLNEMTVAYSTVFNGTPRVSDGPEIILTRGQNIGAQLAQLGANSFEQDDNQKSWTFKDNVTWYGGDHVIKAGVKVTTNKYSRREDSKSNGTYYFDAQSYTTFDASTPYAAQISTVPVQAAKANNNQVGLFIQDDWTVNDHLTVNAGLRWDYESNATNEKFVTPQNIVTALANYPNWVAAGIDYRDYVSTGHNRHPDYKEFQPRLGLSYDLSGDRRTVLFAGAGRYYDRALFIDSGIETLKALYQSVSTIQAPAGSNLSSSLKNVDALRAAAIAQGLGGEVWLLNNNTKEPYSDQFSLGVRQKVGQIQFAVTLSHIRSNNGFMYVRGNRLPNGTYTSQGDQWIEDSFPASGQLPGFNGKLDIGANDGKANYNAIYLTAEKPFTDKSVWGFTSSLTIQSARSNTAQELGSDEFYNGPRQDAYGWEHVFGDEKWRFVGTGIARGPWHTVLSGTLTLASGPAFGNVVFLANPPEQACCYGNMGGAFFPKKDVAYKNLDLRVSKSFTMPWGHKLEASFAGFNVFDWVNRNYSSWGAGGGAQPTFKENGTVGNARSFQAGLKYSF